MAETYWRVSGWDREPMEFATQSEAQREFADRVTSAILCDKPGGYVVTLNYKSEIRQQVTLSRPVGVRGYMARGYCNDTA